MCRDVQKTKQLYTACLACCYVMNITYIASWRFIAINESPDFTVVTNNCDANSVFVCHVTMDSKWLVPSFSIGVDNIRAACGLWTVQFCLTACFTWIDKNKKKTKMKLITLRYLKWNSIITGVLWPVHVPNSGGRGLKIIWGSGVKMMRFRWADSVWFRVGERLIRIKHVQQNVVS